MFKKKFTIFLIIILSFLALGSVFNSALALDVGTNYVDNSIGLGNEDPREVAARVINILMSILGLLAVVLIIYAGFRWMTADGEEENVRKAKKILINAVIGLVIILASWGIATFVINQLLNATGVGSTTATCCIEGDIQNFGCGGEKQCQSDCSWLIITNSNCTSNDPCDGIPATPNICDQDQSFCSLNYFCDIDCFCKPSGGIGDPCDGDLDNPGCDANNNMCSEYLTCNAATCVCEGSPVITSISPFGGFCDDSDPATTADINTACEDDADCSVVGGVCNSVQANGAIDNLISISGHNFSTSTVIFTGGAQGVDPVDLNANCAGISNSNQIIVAVPAGANSGPITVENDDGKTDTTDNPFGPIIEDFVVNTIVRPGLCQLSPDSARSLTTIGYEGLNLLGAKAFFGNYINNFAAFNNSFIVNDSGSADLPNFQAGSTSSFTSKDYSGVKIKSNYLDFNKEVEEDLGPYISNFAGDAGAPGQYVTIYGSGFGDSQGFSEVYFGDIDAANKANYDFPEICADSVWSDNMVIVKVPNIVDAVVPIKMKIDTWEIESSESFTIDNSLDLNPSLCKMSPRLGPHSSPVSLWGEYFGVNGGQAEVFFTRAGNTDLSAGNQTISETGGTQKLSATVPDLAVSGPVRVGAGNSLNFEVGECTKNSDCGAEVCCPSGSPEAGRCVAEDVDDMYKNCFSDIPSSVFQWSFNTAWATATNFDSCTGMARALGSCQEYEFCPNSPGQCSFYPGGEDQAVGLCEQDCSDVAGCTAADCSYMPNYDKCKHNIEECSLDNILTYKLKVGGDDFTTTQTCNNNGKWQVQLNTSCPLDWENKGGGICVYEDGPICDLCGSNFSCLDDENGDDKGICLSNKLCPTGSTCEVGAPDDQCIYKDQANCDCCCRKAFSDEDCCAPLQCTGSCGGSDPLGDLGSCSGCNVSGDMDERDSACNCLNTSGKYCDITVNTDGVCNDCARLSETDCKDHESTCCWDEMSGVCQGGDGTALGGSCAYYECDDCSNPFTSGTYSSTEACEASCDACSVNNNLGDCRAETGCCWDEDSNACQGGDQITLGVDTGKCDYYNCNAAGSCELKTSGTYSNLANCQANCGGGNTGGLGKACVDNYTETCDSTICGNPFSCVDEDGNPPNGNCGTCCCDPTADPGDDVCTLLDANLECMADKGACSGAGRGLCCGCSNDSECGIPETMGCGLDTCCQDRPKVLVDEVQPLHDSTNVCRNAYIEVPFDQAMNNSSFNNNLVLLQQLDKSKVCPSGTFLVNLDYKYEINWWKKITRSIVKLFNSTMSSLGLRNTDTALSASNTPDSSNYIYCQVPGTTSKKGDKTLIFEPNKILSAETVYYAIVKGDKDLNSSSGVLNYQGIGFNGEGFEAVEGSDPSMTFNSTNFYNSYIWSFETLTDQSDNDGICEVNYVRVRPDSYLFQDTTQSIFEDDSDSSSDTYDTVFDKDKAYFVNAYSVSGQTLRPITGIYDWTWDWNVENTDIADLAPLPANMSDNSALIEVVENIKEGETIVKAEINFVNTISATSTPNTAHSVPLYVFSCQNPWPAPADNHSWDPWQDRVNNCDDANPECPDFNYTLYYCRDAGEPGTFDDLPALAHRDDVVINGYSNVCSLTGKSCETIACLTENLCSVDNTCSISGNYCEGDEDCLGDFSDNQCIAGVLKDYYFFRAERPTQVQLTQAEDLETGGSIKLYWNSPINGSSLYNIYYKRDQDVNFSTFEIDPAIDLINPQNNVSPKACIAIAGHYYCQRVINDLQNNIFYQFKVSSLNINNVESQISNQVSGKATDATAPATPLGVIIF